MGGIGDSGAVLYRSAACAGDAVEAMYELTVRHSPGSAAERKRIEDSGGWVTEEQDLFLSRVHHMDLKDPFVRQHAQRSAGLVTTHRVNGELSVSRAIGDPDYKGEGLRAYTWLFPEGKSAEDFTADMVIAVPDFSCVHLRAPQPPHDTKTGRPIPAVVPAPLDAAVEHTAGRGRESPLPEGTRLQFIIIASDGLWDVVALAPACLFVKMHLCAGKSANECADMLGDLAIRMGTADNGSFTLTHVAPHSSHTEQMTPCRYSPPISSKMRTLTKQSPLLLQYSKTIDELSPLKA